jgi:hypothetical protein
LLFPPSSSLPLKHPIFARLLTRIPLNGKRHAVETTSTDKKDQTNKTSNFKSYLSSLGLNLCNNNKIPDSEDVESAARQATFVK